MRTEEELLALDFNELRLVALRYHKALTYIAGFGRSIARLSWWKSDGECCSASAVDQAQDALAYMPPDPSSENGFIGFWAMAKLLKHFGVNSGVAHNVALLNFASLSDLREASDEEILDRARATQETGRRSYLGKAGLLGLRRRIGYADHPPVAAETGDAQC